VMRRAKMAAAAEEISVKEMVLRLVENHLKELEKTGHLPRGNELALIF